MDNSGIIVDNSVDNSVFIVDNLWITFCGFPTGGVVEGSGGAVRGCRGSQRFRVVGA